MAARLRIRDGGGVLRTITQVRVRDSGGTLRTLSRIRVRGPDNALRVVFDPSGSSSFSAVASPPGTHGHSLGTGTVDTNSTTVTPSSGTAPYTHEWTLISHTHPSVVPAALNPTSASTSFRQTSVASGQSYLATFRDTITDSATPASTTTVDVTASFLDTA